MRVPIVCVDAHVRQFASAFAGCFSRPQFRHFVTVLVALLLCRGPRTLTSLLRTVRGKGSLASLSCFLADAQWKETEVAKTWRTRFDPRSHHAWPLCTPNNGRRDQNGAVVPRHPS